MDHQTDRDAVWRRRGVTLASPTDQAAAEAAVKRLLTYLRSMQAMEVRGHSGDVFMRRYRLFNLPWCRVYLHQFLRGDEELCLHDHPWRFVTLILSGGYSEVMPGGTRWRPPGTLLYRPAQHRHRVDCSRPCWTIVVVGRKSRAWGFWTCFGWRAWQPDQPRPICEDQR